MKYRIFKRKLSFYQHLLSLDENSVASRVARVEARAGYPGLVKEYETICTELGLPTPVNISKASWKNWVKKAIVKANRSFLLEEIRKYKKMNYDELKNEEFISKDYLKNLTLDEGRIMFSIRTKMVRGVKLNYSSDPKNGALLWRCSHCDCMDSQSHILKCESYKYLREGKSLDCDKDLVSYFREVITLREKMISDI